MAEEDEDEAPVRRRRIGRRSIAAGIALGFALAVVWRNWPRPAGPAPASAQDAPTLPAGLEIDGEARVSETVDGDTVVLADGRQVRLVGTQAPKLALGRPDFTDWPLAGESKAGLAALAEGRTVRLAFGGLRRDRHGRTLAHLEREDGLWLQGAMLAAGLSRVYSFPDNRAAVAAMLALETAARRAGAGIWSHPFYAIRTPREAADHIGSFELVEGRVLHAAQARAGTYLNFGRNWKSDFTIFLRRDDRRNFDADGADLLTLEGARVRVRGWLVERDGPMIEIDHPEQIEVL